MSLMGCKCPKFTGPVIHFVHFRNFLLLLMVVAPLARALEMTARYVKNLTKGE